MCAVACRLNPTGDFKTTEKKINWVAAVQDTAHAVLVEFDFLITKDKIEEEKGEKFEDFITPQSRFETPATADIALREIKPGTCFLCGLRCSFCSCGCGHCDAVC